MHDMQIPAEALYGLRPPEPQDEIDELIASADQAWPIRIVSWTEAL